MRITLSNWKDWWAPSGTPEHQKFLLWWDGELDFKKRISYWFNRASVQEKQWILDEASANQLDPFTMELLR